MPKALIPPINNFRLAFRDSPPTKILVGFIRLVFRPGNPLSTSTPTERETNMQLFTQYQYEKLLLNGKPEYQDKDHKPVVKLFTPDANCTWLITEIHHLDIAFGLCDLGMGFPELGYVYIPEILEVRGRLGLPVERDQYFKAKYPISVYARAASVHGYIVENETILGKFAA
jgi:hypothetical protein